MQKHQVMTEGDALAYLTDCTLATVCSMASKKSRPKSEYSRQISIAQTAIDWMQSFGVKVTGTRAEEVLKAGSVADWARKFEN